MAERLEGGTSSQAAVLTQEKISALSKHLYDSKRYSKMRMCALGSGNLTEKGKIILKEVGVVPEDIDDR
jgi:hypothetical protein